MLDANRERFISILSEGAWLDVDVALEGRRGCCVGKAAAGWGTTMEGGLRSRRELAGEPERERPLRNGVGDGLRREPSVF